MSRRKRRRYHKPPGTAPGTLIADPDASRPVLRVLAFDSERCVEIRDATLDRLSACLTQYPVTWANVDGLGDVELIARLGEMLHLHPLALEDAVNVHQRAKVEQYENHLFITARMATVNHTFDTEQVSLFLGDRFVLTFQEGRPGDPFEPIRERIRKGGVHTLRATPDYVAYCLLDAVIDGYFPLLEALGERMESLEEEILDRPRAAVVSRIHEAKRDLLTLRRAVWPLREAINTLIRDAGPMIGDETRLHLRECYDHTVRIIDFVETYREVGADLMDLYLSAVNQRMSEVMKVLTIMSTIFIPLTFLSSIYGMNFNTEVSPLNMPELNWYWGYPVVLGVMAVISAGMLLFFRRRGWLVSSAGFAPLRDAEGGHGRADADGGPRAADARHTDPSS
jgi:magnesium transporter